MTTAALRAGARATGGPLLTGEPAPGRLRELARHALGHGLAGLLRQCAPGPAPLPGLELVRTKYKPGRSLAAYDRTGQDAGDRWLAMTWAVGSTARSGTGLEAPAVKAVEAQAGRRQLLAPFTRLAASDPASGVSFLVSPADPAMTQLVRLQDRFYLEQLPPTLTGPPPSRQRVILAGLRRRSAEVGRSVTRLAASSALGYGPCDPVRWSGSPLLAVLLRLRLTARCTPLHKARWTSRVRQQLEAAARWDGEVQRR